MLLTDTALQPTMMVEVLSELFENNSFVTSLELKEELREKYPEYSWTQEMVGDFLRNSSLDRISVNGQYNMYVRPERFKSSDDILSMIINKEVLELLSADNPFDDSDEEESFTSTLPAIKLPLDKETLLDLVDFKQAFTKKELRKKLGDYDLFNFKQVFKSCKFTFTGKYTSENHKIYVKLPVSSHYSKTGEKVVKIKDMAKPHIFNTLKKEYGKVTVNELLDSPEDEAAKLIKAFFTWEMRNNI